MSVFDRALALALAASALAACAPPCAVQSRPTFVLRPGESMESCEAVCGRAVDVAARNALVGCSRTTDRGRAAVECVFRRPCSIEP